MGSVRRTQAGVGAIGWLVIVLIALGVLFAGYLWLMLSWAYSNGERAGWVQKLSRKGYLCKTWEGEMAMVSLPGSVPEKFIFTVRDEHVAQQINQVMGRRVSLYYEEHIGLPSSCFGDTAYFVKGVRVIEDNLGGPLPAPAAPAPAQPPAKQ
jgi:hypothetical protein